MAETGERAKIGRERRMVQIPACLSTGEPL